MMGRKWTKLVEPLRKRLGRCRPRRRLSVLELAPLHHHRDIDEKATQKATVRRYRCRPSHLHLHLHLERREAVSAEETE